MRVFVFGEELEEELRDLRSAAPVAVDALEQDVLARLPLGDFVRPGAEQRAIVIVGAIDVAALQHVSRQAPANELQRVGRIDLAVVDDGGERIGRVDGADAVEPVGALRVVGRIVDGVDGELHVGRRERLARHAT